MRPADRRHPQALLGLIGFLCLAAGPAPAQQTVIERLLQSGGVLSGGAQPTLVADGATLLAPGAPTELAVEIWFLPEDAGRLDAAPEPGRERLIVTGAYTSGERHAPEGFVIRRGDPTHPYPQGWDGLLLVAADGAASIHDVSAVRVNGRAVNLRDGDARKRFLDHARAEGLSAIQSHLLINEGRLDLRPVEGAKRFRRRLLFETRDGRIGVFDTSPKAMTLYEAALALEQAEAPRMALNLDMGTYDFCERREADGALESCGVLGRADLSKLTNLVVITRPASED